MCYRERHCIWCGCLYERPCKAVHSERLLDIEIMNDRWLEYDISKNMRWIVFHTDNERLLRCEKCLYEVVLVLEIEIVRNDTSIAAVPIGEKPARCNERHVIDRRIS